MIHYTIEVTLQAYSSQTSKQITTGFYSDFFMKDLDILVDDEDEYSDETLLKIVFQTNVNIGSSSKIQQIDAQRRDLKLWICKLGYKYMNQLVISTTMDQTS